MAVTKPSESPQKTPAKPQLIRSFWPIFRQRSVFLITCMQIIITLVVGCSLLVGGISSPDTIVFWIILIAVAATTIGVNVVIFLQLIDPLRELAYALTQVAGEPTVTRPPNPNARRFERNGLKPLLQMIYELDTTAGNDAERVANDSPLLASALDNSSSGFVILGADRRVLYANKAAPVIDTTEGDKRLALIFDNELSLDAWLDECEQKAVHAEREWVRIADRIPGEEGRRIYDISASYQKGSQAEVVLTLLNRTDGYQPEDDELDFIAFAAHELRGPITVIRGYLDVLGDEIGDKLDTEQQELLKRLVVSSNRLSSYINNILNASRFDRRHLKVHLTEDSLADVYDLIADDMQLRASSQNRLLSVSIPRDLPTVATDRGSLSEVFSNLIDNALKYSNEGGSVEVSAVNKGETVEVSVVDHGIGMPGNVLSNLFHKFYRSHRSRETVAGTGIGLYITKAIIESHGGTISVRSSEGQGSIFTFTLPVYAAVADKLIKSDNSNEQLIEQHGGGWINNHSMYRG